MTERELVSTDAEYLLQYVQIHEQIINHYIDVEEAQDLLNDLNREFRGRVAEKVLKKTIPPGFGDTRSWMSSAIC